jgi:hypothetical protein
MAVNVNINIDVWLDVAALFRNTVLALAFFFGPGLL